MKQYLLKLTAIFTVSLLAQLAGAATKQPTVIWTAVFSNVTPTHAHVTHAYCRAHTPTVMVTTIKQITSKQGVRALNGVNVRYLSYDTVKKDDLYFNIVNAVVSGKNTNGSSWSTKMKLYEQTLSAVGVTYTVWSTKDCKGTFLGTPTLVN